MRRLMSWSGLAVFAMVWLAVPAVTLADDCSDWTPGEVVSCPDYAFWKTLGLLAGALLSASAWMASRWNNTSRPLTPEEKDEIMRDYTPPSDDEPLQKNEANFQGQNSAYDPGGTNMGGGPSGDL